MAGRIVRHECGQIVRRGQNIVGLLAHLTIKHDGDALAQLPAEGVRPLHGQRGGPARGQLFGQHPAELQCGFRQHAGRDISK